MNRRKRREAQRGLMRVEAALDRLMAASEADGRPWTLHGMTGACRDCGATATLRGQGRTGTVRVDINHDDGCPAAAGAVPWSPVQP